MTTTDTPRTDACPHCGAGKDPRWTAFAGYAVFECESFKSGEGIYQTRFCREREARQKLEAEVERLRSAMRSFIDFMDENLGTTADWPMEAAFDDEETCQRHCDHLNAMKRLVKPEDIN